MTRLGVLVTAVVGLLAVPAGASAAPGDVYVIDPNASPAALYRVPAAGGTPQTVADGPPFSFPGSVIFDRGGRLLLADDNAGKIFSVDPATGAVTTFLESPSLPSPVAPALGADGQLYVGNDTPLGLFRVNPATKAVTPLADATGVPGWTGLYSMVIARDRTLYFDDGNSDVFQRPPGGPVTALYDGPALSNADGLVLSADDRTLYVGNGNVGGVIAIDLASGVASPFATTTRSDGLGRLLDGSLVSGNSTDNRLDRIAPDGGVTTFSSAPYGYPHGFAVTPPSCRGRMPTVVGTALPDLLVATRFVDVIAGLGANDTLKGRAAKDVVCGGAGRDKLVGGPGPDLLIGGPGKDTLVGGKGPDRLIGGPGRDKLRGGPGRDRQRQ